MHFFFRPKGKRPPGLQVPPAPPLPIAHSVASPNKKTHQRSQSDATGLFQSLRRSHSGKFS